jgi:hypothetical protein
MRLTERSCPVLVVLLAVSCAAQQPAEPSNGSLRWHAREARGKGLVAIVLPHPREEFAELGDLDNAVAQSSLTRARLMASETVGTEREIYTWYKFRRLETLAAQATIPNDPLDSQRPLEDAPKSLLPLLADEFLVPVMHGTVDVDGVSLSMNIRHMQWLIPADYILFVTFFASGAIGVPSYGPVGFYRIDDIAGELHSVVTGDLDRLSTEMKLHGADRVAGLRAFAQSGPAR